MSLLRTLAATFLLLAAARGNPVITEFMADNVSFSTDEDGAYSDWIEIHNPGAAPLNLTDWALTDDAANLTKWKFPAVTMQPGEFLVVWASAKNKRTPGLPLHTNFSLNKNGEYLALVQPGGTVIEQQFAPEFPALAANESYGLQFTTTNFVAAGATARYLVPPNGTLGTTWTAAGFNANSPTNWGTGATGIGFGLMVPGITVRNVRKNTAYGGLSSVAETDALLAFAPGSPQILAEATVTAASVNYLGEGGDGHYGANAIFPAGGGDYHCIKATGFVQIVTAGVYTFGLNSDDGGRIKIDGATVMLDDSNHGAQDHFGTVTLTAGLHSFEVIMWEGGGGDEVEFFAAQGSFAAWNGTNFHLVGDTAGGGLAAFTLPVGVGSNVIATDIQAVMQNVNATAYVRAPFTATGPGALTSLSLRLRYNDGCVAYLNGTKIAEKNAPASPVFNSTATAARTDAQSLVAEPVNVTAFLPQILNGSNVLAIHGMNTTAANGTFLVLPELIGGTLNAGAQAVFFDSTKATPGSVNGAYSLLGKIVDTDFTVKRGFFTAPFQLTISTTTPGATIRYTLDGSTPTETNGLVYPGPLTISATTVLRAAAFKTGYEPTNVDTETYLFVDDVILQSPTGLKPGPAWPDPNTGAPNIDYGMDPDVVNSADPNVGGPAVVKSALLAIPTISIVTDLPNLFSPTTGIIMNPYGRGFAWERPASVELITPPDALNPNGKSEFQVNCGLRIRGGYSRDPNNPKHGFHIYFRGDYGAAKLNYPLFGHEGTDTFDQIDLRTAENYSWAFSGDGNNTFLREESSRLTQRDMGQPASHMRYFHVYVDGQYFGLFDTDERTEASFAENYFGGAKADYDVVKCEQDLGYIIGTTDGTLAAWTDLWTKGRAHAASPTNANYFQMMGRAADGVTPTADPVLLDADNLIDYMLVTFWMGNLDGATSAFLGNDRANNWFGARSRIGTQGFRFFTHDFEHALFNTGEDRTGPFIAANQNDLNYSNPMFLDQDLRGNAEYRMRWADRVQRHMFNGGALTAGAWAARIGTLAATVEAVIPAESARWGDNKIATPRTRLDWRVARDSVLSYLPVRGPIVLAQLRADGLFPTLDAPVMNPFGGYVASGSEVVMSAPSGGTIYYMPDGSDPRVLGGAIKAGALIYTNSTANETLVPLGATWKYKDDGSDQGTAWRGVGFTDTGWAGGPAELGYGDGDETTTVNGGPAGNRYATTYFRRTFTVANVNQLSALNVSLKYDDQAWIYINGQLAMKTDASLATDPAFNAYTNLGTPDENAFFPFSISPALLVNGTNTIAVEIHQSGAGSSDISFNMSLIATRVTVPTPYYITGTGVRPLRVRAYDSGTSAWSALTDATFLADTDPASGANLAISEIMYHPADPSAAEIAAGHTDADDFEFIEFVNISARNIDLNGLYFYGAISFDFADSLIGRILAPGARMLLVSKKSAFDFRYGAGQPVAGSYSGHLNNAGENLVLYNAAAAAVSDVTYSPAGAWPASADGLGYSLVRVNPDGVFANDNNPARWRRSAALGGNPGASDAQKFAVWKTANGVTSNTADGDGDGLSNIHEYLLGGGVALSDTARLPRLGVSGGYATLTFTRRFAADDATLTVETAPAVTGPWTANGVLLSATANADGTETLVWRAPNPQTSNGPRFFLRAKGLIVP